ncbi:MAG TPA: DUF748 domain-containing protein [Bdellovibrionales bacterium]|nr:DUF748 domain-containing protein [Bdellovibrionales bacterium]
MKRIRLGRWSKVLLILVVLLVAARAALPYAIKSYANKILAGMEGYTGHIDDIDLHLWRGAADVVGLTIRKRDGQKTFPFVSVAEAHASIQWKELVRGRVVSEAEVRSPKLNFVLAPDPKDTQTEVPQDLRDILTRLMPIRLNRVAIRDGEIYFRNLKSEPKFSVYAKDINLDATNLRNTRDRGDTLPARVRITSKFMKDAKFKLNMRLDPVEKPLEFDMDAELTGLDLKDLNDFMRAYAEIDVERGQADLFTEVATSEGTLKGYVKPMLKDVDVLKWKKDKKEGLFDAIWEAIAGTGAEILQNQPKDSQAAKIPIEGKLDNPDIGIFEAIGSILRHALFRSLVPGVEDSIKFRDVKPKQQPKKTAGL